MIMNRRKFIKQAAAAGLMLSGLPMSAISSSLEDEINITILHTNDVHSRLDPFPPGSGRFEGLGGVTRRASLINEIRQTNKNVLLLDAGDILQGTPYFNLYKGEVDFKVMDELKYDAATIGNHDFDAGIDKLAKNTRRAKFDFVNANYDFSNTPMNGLVKNYIIKEIDGLRIGIFGIGIELKDLVPSEWYGETRYMDPIERADATAAHLRKAESCDFVICLSHLGYSYQTTKISDVVLAQSTDNIDLIIGGHTHTFLDIPDVRRNISGRPVIISQVGWAGIKLGRLDLAFQKSKRKHRMRADHRWIRSLGKDSE